MPRSNFGIVHTQRSDPRMAGAEQCTSSDGVDLVGGVASRALRLSKRLADHRLAFIDRDIRWGLSSGTTAGDKVIQVAARMLV